MNVFVTGGTRGVGRAIVEGIASHAGKDAAHIIYLGCRDKAVGAALAAQVGSPAGVSAHVSIVPIVIDVTKRTSVAEAAAQLAADCASIGRPLDALVNNAGVLLERVDRTLSEIIEPTMCVNFDGVCAVTDAILPLLRKGGQVINVSSGAGTRASSALDAATRAELDGASVPALRAAVVRLAEEAAELPRQTGETPVYALSKMALNFYTIRLAREAAHIRVNACSPGFCRTEIAGQDVVYTRQPKDARLGADVVLKMLFSELGATSTGCFFKECSAPGTPLHEARSAEEPWNA